jgi:hypothetical protein
MATYSREDFEEAAAMWYRLDRKAPKRQTPFVIQRRMTQIVNAARRLLKYLQVEDQSQASDGPLPTVIHTRHRASRSMATHRSSGGFQKNTAIGTRSSAHTTM